MSTSSNQERRNHARQQVELIATVSVDGHKAILKTRDLSKGGAFLKKGDSPIPPMGTELFVEISSAEESGEPMVVQAEVVRVTDSGFGIVFLE